MKKYDLVISKEAPSVKDAMWAKPTGTDGFTLYLLDGGRWKAVKVMDDKETSSLVDDVTVAVENKADKVSSATNGHLAGLNASGNLTDSGKKASDFATAAQGTKANSAIQGVKLNGNELTPDSNKKVNVVTINAGTYAQLPSEPTVGQSFFCTDITSEETGAEAGIVLYYNGTHWVNALGVPVEDSIGK